MRFALKVSSWQMSQLYTARKLISYPRSAVQRLCSSVVPVPFSVIVLGLELIHLPLHASSANSIDRTAHPFLEIPPVAQVCSLPLAPVAHAGTRFGAVAIVLNLLQAFVADVVVFTPERVSLALDARHRLALRVLVALRPIGQRVPAVGKRGDRAV